MVPVITEQCGEQKKGIVVPAVDAGTTHEKLVEVELSGALKSPLAVQLLPLVTVWLPLVRTHLTVSPAFTVTDDGENDRLTCWMTTSAARAGQAARRARHVASRFMWAPGFCRRSFPAEPT
jgi:hypothetical protein